MEAGHGPDADGGLRPDGDHSDHLQPRGHRAQARLHGIPSPLYDVDIVLPDGTPAPVGETGEIVVRTDKAVPCGLFMGYYRDEEKTKESWSDGLYHTGRHRLAG